jgi:hypothetical protein
VSCVEPSCARAQLSQVCRSFKKGCTKEKPACARCVRLGYVCEYPSGEKPAARVGSKVPLTRTDDRTPVAGPSMDALAAFQDFDMPSPFIDSGLQLMNYDPLFGALTAGSSMPHMSHGAFQLHMNPELPQVRDWPQFSFSSLIPDLFAGGQNQAWLTSRLSRAHSIRAAHLRVQVSTRRPTGCMPVQTSCSASSAASKSNSSTTSCKTRSSATSSARPSGSSFPLASCSGQTVFQTSSTPSCSEDPSRSASSHRTGSALKSWHGMRSPTTSLHWSSGSLGRRTRAISRCIRKGRRHSTGIRRR